MCFQLGAAQTTRPKRLAMAPVGACTANCSTAIRSMLLDSASTSGPSRSTLIYFRICCRKQCCQHQIPDCMCARWDALCFQSSGDQWLTLVTVRFIRSLALYESNNVLIIRIGVYIKYESIHDSRQLNKLWKLTVSSTHQYTALTARTLLMVLIFILVSHLWSPCLLLELLLQLALLVR